MTILFSSKIRALAHRHMALCALSADSSLETSLKRYSHHMAIARYLDALGERAMSKRSTFTALAYGNSLNLAKEQLPHGQWNARLAENMTAAPLHESGRDEADIEQNSSDQRQP